MSVRTSDAQLDRVITQHHAQRESDFPTDDDRARAIFERVIASERALAYETSVLRRTVSPRRIVGVAAALAIVVGGTAGILAAVSNHAAPAHLAKSSGGMQLVDFTTTPSGDIVARITDPLAAKSQLDAVFEQHGLDIQVSVLPVSPSLVGTIIFDTISGGGVQSLEGGTCIGDGQAGTTTNANECPIGFIIPAGFQGSGAVSVGGPAQTGEAYESSANGFNPGEVLHCSGLLGAPVSAAQTFLTAKNLTPTRWFVTDSADWPVDAGNMVQSDVAPTTGYIVGGFASSANNVLLTIDSTLPTDPGFAAQVTAANAGC
jgi:hypothetical protein